jgi:hypothetical protein
MAKLYEVTNQRQDTVINPAGTNFDDIWEIHYKVVSGPSRGTVGVVKVSESDHNSQHVDRVIRDKIGALSDVAQLGG